MMASVGDYVTAVLLAELAADDEITTTEAASRTRAALLDTFARRRNARQVLYAQLCELFPPEAHKNKRIKKDGNADDEKSDDSPPETRSSNGDCRLSGQNDSTTKTRTVTGSTAESAQKDGAVTTSQHFLYCDKRKFNDFQTYFGIKLETFERIAQYVGPKLVNQEKFRQKPYVKILIGLWLLSTQASFRTIGDKFNIQKSTTYYLFMQFVSVLASLADDFIRWPNTADMAAIAVHFKKNYGFPGVVGLVDACQIPVKVLSTGDLADSSPKERAEPYSTVTFQAVCDHRMRFTNVHVGEPQTPHAVICTWKSFEGSSLGRQLASERGLPNDDHHLLGNSTYPLRTYLLTPYKEDFDEEHALHRVRSSFNGVHKRAHMLVQRALGILNRKFLRLKFINTQRYELVPQIITAACVLHNIILEDVNEDMNDDILRGILRGSYAGSVDNRDYKEEHVHPCPQADHHVLEDAILKRDLVARQMLA